LGATLNSEQLVGAAAIVERDSSGAVVSVAYPPETVAAARPVLRAIAGEIGPHRPPRTAAAAVPRATLFGDGPIQRQVQDTGIVRIRTELTAVRFAPTTPDSNVTATGRWTVTLNEDEGGVIDTLWGGEQVNVGSVAEGRSQIALNRLASDRVHLTEADRARVDTAMSAPASLPPLATTARGALDQRVGDMTLTSLTQALRAFANAGRMPKHASWLWQATGLLQRYPEHAAALAAEFTRSDDQPLARGLIVDLLANVGHAEAQSALRQLLSLPEVAELAEYGALMQHLSLLNAPEAATLEFVRDRFETESAAVLPEGDWHPLAHALGAVAGAARLRGDDTGAEAATASLVAALEVALDQVARVALLDGLGNAGVPMHLAIIVRKLGDDDGAVRSAAARALRKYRSSAAIEALLGGVGDALPAVQREAIRSLEQHVVGANHVAALTERVTT
jgi:hypothetical protein